MTTFVPLAADTDGTVSAVAVGEWILQVMKGLCTSQETQAYYHNYLEHFVQDPNTKEQRMRNPLALFNTLLSQHELVFKYLRKARDDGEIVVSGVDNTPVKKTPTDVLREVEEFFTFLMSLIVLRIERNDDAGTAAREMVDAIQNGDDLPELRLRLLQALYNVFPPSFPFRVPIFINILHFAEKAKLFHLMLPYIDYIDDWMKDWNLTSDSKREVFLILSNNLKALGKIEEAYPHLKRHVEFYQGERKEILQNSVAAAVELAELSLRLPEVTHFDCVISLDAVRQLLETEHAPLFNLLEVFVSRGPLELAKLREAHPGLFERYSLDYDMLEKKIKLLAVASLAASKNEVPIKEISESLKVTEAEAEELVVQAIGQNLLDAKIDQLHRIVHITSAMQREFNRPQWEELKEKVDRWSESVRMVLHTVQTSKASGHPNMGNQMMMGGDRGGAGGMQRQPYVTN